MTKILMVCLGNICRSPLAEGILRAKLDATSFLVDSAGTAPYHLGCPPDIRSINVAKKHGIDISDHRGQQISIKDFYVFDYIYVMDKINYKNVSSLASSHQKQKVKLILDELYPNKQLEIPDPYYGTEDNFEEVYQMLEAVCEKISQKLTKNASR